MKTAPNELHLELHVDDFEKVKEFYGKMGFKVVWERRPEAKKGYLVMKRGKTILCFWCGTEDVYKQSYFQRFPKTTKKGYAVEIVININNIPKFYGNVKKFAKIVEPLKTQPWGLKDFRIEDPFGFYIRFSEPHNILDPANAVK